ncbi:MAG: asparagine synthase (glutamine-hydrolyzing) [Vicinamibacterales bacterium]
MCGIAGVVHRREGLAPPDFAQLGAMAGALRHRGPDESGLYRDRLAGLAHVRLSIIDLATGQQPLTNERRTLWLTFNGEIFNYLELRDELVALGHVFATRSDTEVIVHAYEQWGADAFRRFNGQWAVGLWDSERHELVLARDPFGVRPLYVAEHDGRLLFASEVKALFAGDPSLPRRIDARGLDQLFTFWTPVAPQTVFEGIEEVEPGTVRIYGPGGTRRTRSYDPAFPAAGAEGFTGSVADAAEAVRTALADATSLRMLRADVPVGSYLSGGLDSSLIAALGLRAKGAKFCTFSLRFEDTEYDETVYQRTMADRLGSEHHEVVVSRGDIGRVFPDVVWHTERPVLRTAPAPLYLLSKLVHDAGIKVVLTGEGADEMFAGYDIFREARIRRFWGRQPQSTWRPRLLERLYPYLQRSPVAQQAVARQFFGRGLDRFAEPGFGHDPRWTGTAALKRLFSADLRSRAAGLDARADLLDGLPGDFGRWSALAQDQFLEVHTLLSGYLLSSQGDRMLMAHSVEGRFPFLDRRVAALAEVAAAGLQAARARREARPEAGGRGPPPGRHPRTPEAAIPGAGRAVLRHARGARVAGRGDQPRRGVRGWVLRTGRGVPPGRQVPGPRRGRTVLERRQHGPGRRRVHPAGLRALHPAAARGRGAHRDSHGRGPRVRRGQRVLMMLHELLEGSAGRAPGAPCLVERDRLTSYGELDALANRYGNLFLRSGVSCGDRIVIALENSLDMVAAYFGALKAGAVAVPLQAGPRNDRLAHVVADCRPRVCVVDAPGAAALASAAEEAGIAADGAPVVFVLSAPAGDARDLRQALDTTGAERPPARAIDLDLAAIIYTSGSTGDPRGVMLTHRNFVENAQSIVSYLGLTSADRVMCVLPFHYVYGLSLLHTHLLVGGSIVIENRAAFPNVVLDGMRDHAVTGFAGVPSTFALMLHRSAIDEAVLPHLRYVTQAGGAMPSAKITEWLARGPRADFYVMYGATEAAARLTYLPPADLVRKLGSIGRPIPNVEIAIVTESGERARPMEVGELIARGPNISCGYWNDAEETERRFGPLGYRTGDLGYVDDEGFLYLVGRRHDMIKVGAHRVGAKEIEDVLHQHPAVHEAAVVAAPHQLLGEAPVAFVALKDGGPDGQALRAFCAVKLAAYKVPVRIEVERELPKLPGSGKIDRTELRRHAAMLTVS